MRTMVRRSVCGAVLVAGTALVSACGGQPDAASPAAVSEAAATDSAAVTADELGDALTAEDLATLTGWMQATTPTAADGFDQEFGLIAAAAPTTGAVAAKQGWMCCVDSRRQLHSSAVLADGQVVVLLGDFPSSTSWSTAQLVLDRAASAVLTAL